LPSELAVVAVFLIIVFFLHLKHTFK